MNTLVVLLLPFWVVSSIWLSSYARPEPTISPVPDPVLPNDTQSPVTLISSQMPPHSPGVAVSKVVHHQAINKNIVMTLIISSILLCAIFVSWLCFWVFGKRNIKNSDSESKSIEDSVKGLSTGSIVSKNDSSRLSRKKGSVDPIDYQLLVTATDGFGKDNVLDEGGIGCLYKAQFNINLLAAVKRVHTGTHDAQKEFENEVDWLSKLCHQNIVSLQGYCVRGDFRFLVYEMMHNGTLESLLHGPSNGSNLTWNLRMKIALDLARGLEFLHERCNPPVIHRDLKPSNILLDYKFNAKLSAFGQAVTSGSRIKDNLKLSGSMRYVAPEYFLDGKLTDKSDVYAFGVILVELLMGRNPAEKAVPAQNSSNVTWAMPQLSDRFKLPDIIDPAIRDTMDLKHLYQVAAIAVLCVQPEPSYRPLITDVLHSFIPLVPLELGGSLRNSVSETSLQNIDLET